MSDRPDRPDDSDPPESRGEAGQGGDRRLDIDAAFEAIVANFGTPPALDSDSSPADEPDDGGRRFPAAEEPDEGGRRFPAVEEPDEGGRLETPGDPDRLRNLFRPAWDQPEPDDPEDHFVPPPPPPLPVPEPRRRLAWFALFGGPALMLLAIVIGISLPGWVMFLLSAGFVGGFVYLVATMSDSGRGHWPGDDGAVV